MSVTAKALWVIERNHGHGLTLEDIAEACGVSKFHLAHAFGQSTGRSVMDYLRGRRLTEAARRLVMEKPEILNLALECGYGSHEAFTRAFKACFGKTPEAVRSMNTLEGLPLIEPRRVTVRTRPAGMEPTIRDGNRILAVGLSQHYSFGATEGVAGQWQRFMTGMIADIPNQVPGIPIGVTTNVDADGNFDHVTAVEVTAAPYVPARLVKIDIEPRRWAVFDHSDHVSTLSQTYAVIWDEWLPEDGRAIADAPSIERHKPSFDPRTGLGGVEIWIPVAA